MAFHEPDPSEEEREAPFGWLPFLALIALSIFVGAKASMRGMGVLLTLGVLWSWRQKRISYGLDGRPASGYITGWPALVLKIVFALLGLLIAIWPDPFMAFFDWHGT